MNPILIAPTTISNTPPLEYIEIAARAGYDGIGIRLYPSPHIRFFPVVGDKAMEAKVKAAARDTGIKVYEIFTCYLTEDMDFEAMKRAHEFGAELGASYALVIGDDPDWSRMVHNFGTLCDNAAQFGLTCTLEAPVNRRALTSLELNLKLLEESGRTNVGLSVDPLQFTRAGNTPDQLKAVDPKLLPYTQICDGKSMTPGEPYCCPGEGMVPMKQILDIMPAGLPLSLEWHNRSGDFTDADWAKHALDETRAYLQRYYAEKK